MQSPIAQSLDAVNQWREALEPRLDSLVHLLAEQGLLEPGAQSQLAALKQRLASSKLVLAFVAEFSRGKSELINAIFFADAGRRVLPATPGRTTMCPVELRYDAGVLPQLSLLPIESRQGGASLSELRTRDASWQHVPLDPADPKSLAQALVAVTRTQWVSVDQARSLGLWNDDQDEDNPPQAADGQVEVPAWRHALINYPHPLLRRGLVVIDTPGLNAVGAEPELTLGLLPSAHAIVFVLAADTGVTRSDLAVWREYFGAGGIERFVVLNKIDTLADPLASSAEVADQVERQASNSAALLGTPRARVYALSARDALAARLAGDAPGLAASGLPPFERALADSLLPRQQAMWVDAALSAVEGLRAHAERCLVDRRRLVAESQLELRGLRGKSSAKLRLMIARIDIETAEFERCTGRLMALRAVQMRLQGAALAHLGSDVLRTEVAAMQVAIGARPLGLGARAAFDTLISRLRERLQLAQAQASEMRQMLEASFAHLNTEFGFVFVLTRTPSMTPFIEEVGLIEHAYGRYFSLTQLWRMATPGFAEQFRRMLLSKLRVAFENAAGEIEVWSKAAAGQVELQLLERRRGFTRRRDALQRVHGAAGELEQRLAEVQEQEAKLAQLQSRVDELSDAAVAAARALKLAAGSAPVVGPGIGPGARAGSPDFQTLRQDAA